jgi:thiamine biosynthesis lipoprotein
VVQELKFRAMGTDVHLLTVGGDPAGRDLAAARRLVEDLERRWSRFRPDSELSQLNAAAGHPFTVEEDTFALLAAAVDAWYLTGGLFDPTVLPALVAAGYDRSFETLIHTAVAPAGPVPGCGGIVLIPGANLVRLPEAVTVDLGGIAKGHSADRAALALLEMGAAGAMANLGGDVRVAGTPPEGDCWLVAVDDPRHPGRDLAVARLAAGAVATSSRLQRRWRQGGQARHHLIDPRTGRPAAGDVDASVIVAAEAAWAEVLAKAVVVAGFDGGTELVQGFSATGLILPVDETARPLEGIEAFLR